MYNQALNDKWIEKLKREVDGKRIVMVGNAASIFSEEYGELIDSFDFVVRFGKGVPYKEFKAHIGNKTDMWFFGTGRAGMRDKFKQARYKMYTMSQLNLYKPGREEMVCHRSMMDGSFQPYKDFFFAGSANDVLDCNREIFGEQPEARISQGAQCIHFFANKVDTYASIDLIGFDFFGQGFVYNIETGKQHIPKVQPTTSWHMPLISKEYDGNPHNKSSLEESYIRAVPRLKVHQMKPVDLEKMDKVLKRLRGSKTNIIGDGNDSNLW